MREEHDDTPTKLNLPRLPPRLAPPSRKPHHGVLDERSSGRPLEERQLGEVVRVAVDAEHVAARHVRAREP